MLSVNPQNVQAIKLHSIQADIFASRYNLYAADFYKDCFVYSRHRLQLLLDRYLKEIDQSSRILDVGCGTGHYIAEYRRRGFDVVGVDGSSEMLEHARQKNPGAELRLADVDALPFPDQSFNCVICIEVLRYLPDPSRCILEMARVLKPGGICLFTAMPLFNLNGYWLVNRLAGLVRFGNLVRLRQFFMTSWQIRRQCRKAGFVSPRIHGVYSGPINWVQRLTPSILPLFLRGWERFDEHLADNQYLRELSNMFLVRVLRK